ncbi:hypothetical protein AMK59_4564 [Oryctes borbonicus]|uniref:Alpha-1,3-mannosyl-glycoprotein 2-beta-N-acetylglucosaminyltransferase n=1 Tax=Oryctes borbonicus TaxID=1629725 RepID=A0A0T6B8T5_9SCAR|nr:hypothetical protein AMK59_4564 [Oryctes borbonicus]
MRLKTTYIIGVLLIIWASFIYFTFINRPLSLAESPENIDNQLNALEGGIDEQFRQNREMISKVHTFLEYKKRNKMKNESSKQTKKEHNIFVIPILVFACNRVSVSRCLDQLIRYRPNPDQFPIIVSQDCNHKETTDVINKYGSQVTLIKQPDQSDIEVLPQEKKFKGYFKIARHYGWALNQTFFNFNFDAVIIVEDDLEVAPDFFEYFTATYPLLLEDPTLWCISAWNDNGKIGLVNENKPEQLYRTDFFPGLGWMLTKKLWSELCTKWPKSYWDDWIRQPNQRKERTCIRPEISRTKTFGKIGVSK